MRQWLFFAAIVLAPIGLVSAQSSIFIEEVGTADPDANTHILGLRVDVSFVDANGNDVLDVAEPDEPVYLDMDLSQAVSYGDIRLTPFVRYAAGTAVSLFNRDVGRPLHDSVGAQAWFARTSDGVWVVDFDISRTLTAGDVWVQGPDAGTKVEAGDDGVGDPITAFQERVALDKRAGWRDANDDGRRDWRDPIYLDLDGDEDASVGEPRIRSTGLAPEDDPSREEFDGAVERLDAVDAELRGELTSQEARDNDFESRLDRQDVAFAEAQDAAAGRDKWLLALGIVDLLAIAVVGFLVWRMRGAPGQ